VVDHDPHLGVAACELRDVPEMVRIDAWELEYELRRFDELETWRDGCLQDPVWIGLIVDEMPNSSQLRAL